MRLYTIIVLSLLVLSVNALAQTKDNNKNARNIALAKSDSLFALGVDLYSLGKYEEAIPIFTESDKIDKTFLDSTSNRRYYSSIWLAACYYQLGDSTRAEKINSYYRFKPIDRRLTIKSDSLGQIGSHHFYNGDFAQAAEYFRLCYQLEKDIIDPEHPFIANSMMDRALCLFNSGNHAEAIRIGEEAHAMRKNTGGRNHPDYRSSLTYLYYWNYLSKAYPKAIAYGTELLPLLQDDDGGEAQDLYLNVAPSLLLAYCQEKLYADAVMMSEHVMPRLETGGSEMFKHFLRWTAKAYAGLGRYAEALNSGLKSLSLHDVSSDESEASYRATLHEVADYYSQIGNYEQAVSMERKALDLIMKHDGVISLDYAVSAEALSIHYYREGEYSNALPVIEEALAVYEQTVGKNTDRYVSALCNMGRIYMGLNDWTSMLACYQSALELSPAQMKEEIQIVFLHHLSEFLSWGGRHELAVEAQERALGIAENSLKLNESAKLMILSQLVRIYIRANRIMEHLGTVDDLLARTEGILMDAFKNLTAYERTQYWSKYRYLTETMLPFISYCHPNAPEATIAAFNGTLLGKGLLLNSEIEFNNLIKESGDEESLMIYRLLQSAKKQVNQLRENYSYADSIQLRSFKAKVDSLTMKSDKIERELISRCKVYGDFTHNLTTTWVQVQGQLDVADVAVEFVSFPVNADSTMYIAYALKKGWECPKMIPLFEEKELMAISDRYGTDSISSLVWKPLDEFMHDVENVYFAPSGELYNIAIESVPTYEDGGATLIGEHGRNYYRLSSTRELALIKDESHWDEAAVYGGLQYDMSVSSMVDDGKQYPKQRGVVDLSFIVTNDDDTSRDDRDVYQGLPYLKGTKVEALAVKNRMDADNVPVRLFTDNIGTEASFKALNGKKTSIIHIGTHGFFNKKVKEYNEKDMLTFGLGNQKKVIEDAALTNSGLYFAGADNAIMNRDAIPDSIDDGKLTALEIAQLDLRGLDLVVLSACQTGLGEITGDGVFGLQRGFKKAGAQTIVMSLWKVDDDATTEFMTRFFQNIEIDSNGHPTNKQQAFRDAQQYLRTMDGGKFNDPKYWAAFVMLDGIS